MTSSPIARCHWTRCSPTRPEIEDLLRDTLVAIAKTDLGWDVEANASSQPARPIVDIFVDSIPDFSKYKLAKAFLRWTRNHEAADLAAHEAVALGDSHRGDQ